MCGFILTNKNVVDEKVVGHYVHHRGPDACAIIQREGWTCIHYLLHITGEKVPQPLEDSAQTLWGVFNGEIYDYKQFGDFRSDGEYLLQGYDDGGTSFLEEVDGEFASVFIDWEMRQLVVSADVFATKPLWYAREGKDLGVASYASALARLGFRSPQKVPANTGYVFELDSGEKVDQFTLSSFDLRQHKGHYLDWIAAFERAVSRRVLETTREFFIGISGGYDSGAIALALLRQSIPFRAYSVLGDEDQKVVAARRELLSSFQLLKFTVKEYQVLQKELQLRCENFAVDKFSIYGDKASYGLSAICKLGRADGCTVYLSGQGADEVLSDYGKYGKAFYSQSQLKGRFPKNLKTVFPWRNFFGGSQVWYLMKEEYVAGSWGIEARYPFLDKQVVQEFLWLTPELKNRKYKAPLHAYFMKYKFPFAEDCKVGFRTSSNLVKV